MVFALLAVEDLDVDDALRTAIATMAMTVLLSVILHGLTADVFAARYGAWIDRTRPPAETRRPRPSLALAGRSCPGITPAPDAVSDRAAASAPSGPSERRVTGCLGQPFKRVRPVAQIGNRWPR